MAEGFLAFAVRRWFGLRSLLELFARAGLQFAPRVQTVREVLSILRGGPKA